MLVWILLEIVKLLCISSNFHFTENNAPAEVWTDKEALKFLHWLIGHVPCSVKSRSIQRARLWNSVSLEFLKKLIHQRLIVCHAVSAVSSKLYLQRVWIICVVDELIKSWQHVMKLNFCMMQNVKLCCGYLVQTRNAVQKNLKYFFFLLHTSGNTDCLWLCLSLW